MMTKKNLNIKIDEELKTKFHSIAVSKNTKMTDVLIEAIKEYVEKNSEWMWVVIRIE